MLSIVDVLLCILINSCQLDAVTGNSAATDTLNVNILFCIKYEYFTGVGTGAVVLLWGHDIGGSQCQW